MDESYELGVECCALFSAAWCFVFLFSVVDAEDHASAAIGRSAGLPRLHRCARGKTPPLPTSYVAIRPIFPRFPTRTRVSRPPGTFPRRKNTKPTRKHRLRDARAILSLSEQQIVDFYGLPQHFSTAKHNLQPFPRC